MPSKNPWLKFLATFKKANPSLSMKQAMKQGAVKYRSQKGSSKPVKKKVKKKKARRSGVLFCWLVNRFLAVAEYVSHAGFLGLQVGAVLVGYFRFHGDAVDDL